MLIASAESPAERGTVRYSREFMQSDAVPKHLVPKSQLVTLDYDHGSGWYVTFDIGFQKLFTPRPRVGITTIVQLIRYDTLSHTLTYHELDVPHDVGEIISDYRRNFEVCLDYQLGIVVVNVHVPTQVLVLHF
jgi:hypothetical protein